MKLEDLDITVAATAALAVILVVGALVLNGLGRTTPEWLVSALSLAIGAYFGQARSLPGTRDHTAALRENTQSNREVAYTLENGPLTASLANTTAQTAQTAALTANTAAQVAQTAADVASHAGGG